MTSTKTVLIVENDPDARWVLCAILNYDGYHVLEAADGAEGVALAREQHPDAIIMDIRMPLMNGIEASKALRADEQTRHIPIVALTGDHAGSRAAVARADAMFHSWLWKPIEPRQVMDHVRSIIGDP